MSLSEAEREIVKRTLEAIEAAQNELEGIDSEKKKIKEEQKVSKQVIIKPLIDNPKAGSLTGKNLQVVQVNKKHHRRPSLQTVYEAVQNVLGATFVEQLKQAVENEKRCRKDGCEAQLTCKLVKMGKLRKTRKDKMAPGTTKHEITKTINKEKKRKFMRRNKSRK
jgi:hypothetical protein